VNDKKSLAETIGLFAVVASLVFVGMEVRQAAIETRSSTVLQVKDSWVQFNLAMMESQDLFESMQIVISDGREADPEATFVVDAWLRALCHNWSNAYFHYQNGTLDEVQWMAHARDAEGAAQLEYFLDFWPEWRHVFDDGFVSFIDSAIAKTAATQSTS